MEDIKRWIWKLTLMLLLLLSLWRLWLQSYSRCNNDMHESKVSMLYFHYLNSFLVLKRKIWDVCIPRRKTNLSPLEHQNHKGLVPALPNLYRNGGHSEVSFHEVCYSGEDVIFPRQVTRWTHSLFQLLLTLALEIDTCLHLMSLLCFAFHEISQYHLQSLPLMSL